MADLGQAYVQIVPSADGISGAIQKVLDPEADSAGRSAGTKVGGGIGEFAKKAVVALGVGKTISDTISNGMNFESMSAKASTLFSGTSAEFKNLQTEIMGISSATGVAASELMNAAYSAESASVPMGNLGSMIEASSKLATAGFTDIDTALSATAKTMNAYGMMSDDVAATQANMEKVQRVLIQTQNKGITTVGELGASLSQVTPTAASFGVSFEQVGAALAGMTAQGTPTAQATTQLNSLIAELGKEGTTASTILKEKLGASFKGLMGEGWQLEEVLQAMAHEVPGLEDLYANISKIQESGTEDWGEAFDTIIEQSPKAKKGIVDMFGSIEAGKAALSILNSDWEGNMQAMATDTDVVGDAFSTMADTASFKLQKLKNTLTNMGISAFSASADVFAGALEGIQRVIDKISPGLSKLGTAFSNLFSKLVGYIANIMGINDGLSMTDKIAAILNQAITALTQVFDFLAQNINIIAPIVMGLVGAFTALSVVQTITSLVTGLVGAIGLIVSPVGLVVVAIAAAIAIGVALYKNWDQIKKAAGTVFKAVQTTIANVMNGIKNTFTTVWNAIKSTITSVLNGIKSTVTSVWNAIKATVTSVVNGIKSTISNVWNAIKSTVTSVVNGIKSTVTSVWNSIKTTVSNVMNGIKSKISSAWNAAKSTVSSVINGIKSTISSGLNGAKSTVTSIFNSIKSKITSVMNGAKNAVSSAINAIKNKFKFHWSLPKLKLPHVSISGHFSLNPPSAPHFGISWHKEGAIIDGASVVGVGEAGPEAIVPLSGHSMRPFAEAIAEELGGRDDREVLELLREYLPMLANMKVMLDRGTLVGQLAPAMNARMGVIAAREARGN